MAFYALWDQIPCSPVFLMLFPSTPHRPTRDTRDSKHFDKFVYQNLFSLPILLSVNQGSEVPPPLDPLVVTKD